MRNIVSHGVCFVKIARNRGLQDEGSFVGRRMGDSDF